MSQQNGWIGVDLDGTLAHYEGWKGIEHIGAPVPAMLERVKNWLAEGKAALSHYLPDPDGRIGRAYGAKTTPHMYVIDGKGMLVYAGAIDDKRSANVADVAGAKNYVAAVLAALAAGRPVADASTAPYGCSVKY